MLPFTSFLLLTVNILLLCDGRPSPTFEDVVTEPPGYPQSPVTPETSTEKDRNLDDLIGAILEAIERCKREGVAEEGSRRECAEHLESLVLDLSPDKRKALTEILDLVLASEKPLKQRMLHGPQGSQLGEKMDKTIEVFTLRPWSINIEEMMRHILQPPPTTLISPSEMEHLKKLVYGGGGDLENDKILEEVIERLFGDSKTTETRYLSRD